MPASRFSRMIATPLAALALATSLLAIGFVLLAALAPAKAFASPDAAEIKALDYLHACQHADGGFAEKGSASSESLTAWTICAIASAGEDPNAWRQGGLSPVDFLAKHSAKWTAVTDQARTVLAAVAAGKSPRSFGGVDLVAKLKAAQTDRGSAGVQIGPAVNSHVWAMIALHGAGEALPDGAATWLLGQQNSDGGWGWAPNGASDPNDTAAALEALAAADTPSSSAGVKQAVAYLRARQSSGGGFAYSSTAEQDAQSTSWVVQGLTAAGQVPTTWEKGGHDPLEALRGLQVADGSVKYTASRATTPLFATVQALPALFGMPFPIARGTSNVERDYKPTLTPSWPAQGASIAAASSTQLSFKVDDAATGVLASAVSVRVDGHVATASVAGDVYRVQAASLTVGAHTVTLAATDRAGNAATPVTWRFTVTGSSSSTATGPAAAAGVYAATTGGMPGSTLASGTGSALATATGSAAASGDAAGMPPAVPPAADGAGAAKGLVVSLLGLGVALVLGFLIVQRLQRDRRFPPRP